jgi:hypothetical protein
MADVKQHREPPDLVKKIADLERRLAIMETARRLGNASIDGGRLTIRGGDLAVVNDNDELVLLIAHGDTPSITMIPNYVTGGWAATQFAWESDDQGASYQVQIENPDGVRDGGKILLNRDTSYYSHQPLDTTPAEAFMALGDIQWGGNREHIRFRGRWGYNGGYDSQDAVVFGFDNVVAGFGASIYLFPFAFDRTPVVVYGLQNAGTAVAHDLAAVSNTGFTISWATGTTAKTIMWAAFRL